MIRQYATLVGSQAWLALVGVATVPILFRNLGPEVYGDFSIYLLIVGMLVNLDFTRPLLIKEMAGGVAPPHPQALSSLAAWNTLLLTAAAAVLGLFLLGPAAAIAGGLTLMFNGFSMPRYAYLVAADRIGETGMVRNLLWSGAILSATGASFFLPVEHAWLWGFAVANGAVLVLYGVRVRAMGGTAVVPAVAWRGPVAPFRRDAWELAGFGAALLIVQTADRFLFKWSGPADDFGIYSGAADLILKANILSLALANAIFPVLSRMVRDQGAEAADKWFARIFVRALMVAAVAAAAGLALGRPLAPILLGADGAASAPVLQLLSFGVCVQMMGTLLMPWQRAHGDFTTQRVAYSVGAALMLVGGAILIPAYGLVGAVLTWFLGRSSDLILLGASLRRLPVSVFSRGARITLFVGLIGFATVAVVIGMESLA